MSTKVEKTVAGMTRNQMHSRATERALATNVSPVYVGNWISYFDLTSCDNLRDKGQECCKGCRDTDKCEGKPCISTQYPA